MSQSPSTPDEFEYESDYASAAKQLNKLVRSGRSYSGHERNCFFVNVDGKRFANASMVSGFDFPDDGRAVALCDWDGDGTQDLWVANRNAPQIRFMHNTLQDKQNFVRFQLEGTQSNRDAVGARVMVHTSSPSGKKKVLQRTLRAGEGFLACSSKRIHFGLGEVAEISDVAVRWPSGKTEQFGALKLPQPVLLLKEGAGKPRPTVPNSTSSAPFKHDDQPIPLPAQTMATHNWLTEPCPTPPLIYQRFDGSLNDASVGSDKPTLINLWATWCQPCLTELAEWNKSKELHEEATILAVSMDGLGEEQRQLAVPQNALTQLGFAGESALATPSMVDALQLLQNVIYDHHRSLPVPCSFLLDRKGQLRAIYKGGVSATKLRADIARINNESVAAPLAGTWLGESTTHNVSLLVEELFNDGYETEANAYVERLTGTRLLVKQMKARLFLAEKLSQADSATAKRHLEVVLKTDPKNAVAHERLGLILARERNGQAAMRHFQLALQNSNPPLARTHFNFGRLLRQGQAIPQATEQFRKALEISPKFADAHEQLGLIYASQNDFVRAADHFQKASRLRPESQPLKVNLAMAFSRLGNDKQAWEVLREMLLEKDGRKEDAPKMALLLGARTLERLDRVSEAVPLLERFLQAEPKADDVRKHLRQLQEQMQP